MISRQNFLTALFYVSLAGSIVLAIYSATVAFFCMSNTCDVMEWTHGPATLTFSLMIVALLRARGPK